MDIVDRLNEEHIRLRREMEGLERGQPGPVEFRTFAQSLLRHARAEDDLLFCDLEELIGSAGPIVAMRDEHEAIEGALEWLSTHQPADAGWSSTVTRLLQTTKDHFVKEEMVLFAIARQRLDQERLVFLGDALAAMRSTAGRQAHNTANSGA